MINLYFREFNDLDLFAKGAKSNIIRLFVDARFKTSNGWTDPYPAIVDTGAHITIIPFNIWNECLVNLTTEYVVRGLVPKRECTLPILIGNIICALVDKEKQTEGFEIQAYLAHTNNVPLIVGFCDLLEKFKVYMDYSNKKAYIE